MRFVVRPGKWTRCFPPMLVPDQTGLVNLIGDNLFEGSQSRKIRLELYGLNVYSAYLSVMRHSNPV
jgi:hypothetical protein